MTSVSNASVLRPLAAMPPGRVTKFRRAIVVLGCPARPDGTPSAALQRRLEAGLSAARADLGAAVVVTGGTVVGPAEGPVMAAWLESKGIDPARIFVESKSRFTLENARLSVPILARLGVQTAKVVTDDFHLARGVALLRAVARASGLALVVEGLASSSGLTVAQAAQRQQEEQAKTRRDLANVRPVWPSAAPLAPERFARRLSVPQVREIA